MTPKLIIKHTKTQIWDTIQGKHIQIDSKSHKTNTSLTNKNPINLFTSSIDVLSRANLASSCGPQK